MNHLYVYVIALILLSAIYQAWRAKKQRELNEKVKGMDGDYTIPPSTLSFDPRQIFTHTFSLHENNAGIEPRTLLEYLAKARSCNAGVVVRCQECFRAMPYSFVIVKRAGDECPFCHVLHVGGMPLEDGNGQSN